MKGGDYTIIKGKREIIGDIIFLYKCRGRIRDFNQEGCDPGVVEADPSVVTGMTAPCLNFYLCPPPPKEIWESDEFNGYVMVQHVYFPLKF